jgi:hypothetical protein
MMNNSVSLNNRLYMNFKVIILFVTILIVRYVYLRSRKKIWRWQKEIIIGIVLLFLYFVVNLLYAILFIGVG